jgi:hypothetical protein
MVLLAALSAAGAFARDVRAVSRGVELPPELDSRLVRIETALRQGDASSLRLSFSKTGKVRVEIRDLSDGRPSYGAGQLHAIFDRIFETCQTRDFVFDRDDVKVSAPGTAFARARWLRNCSRSRGPAGPGETVEPLTFTLQDEDGDWRIVEIRSSR